MWRCRDFKVSTLSAPELTKLTNCSSSALRSFFYLHNRTYSLYDYHGQINNSDYIIEITIEIKQTNTALSHIHLSSCLLFCQINYTFMCVGSLGRETKRERKKQKWLRRRWIIYTCFTEVRKLFRTHTKSNFPSHLSYTVYSLCCSSGPVNPRTAVKFVWGWIFNIHSALNTQFHRLPAFKAHI